MELYYTNRIALHFWKIQHIGSFHQKFQNITILAYTWSHVCLPIYIPTHICMYAYICNTSIYVTHPILTKIGNMKTNMLKNCIGLTEFHYLMLTEFLYINEVEVFYTTGITLC